MSENNNFDPSNPDPRLRKPFYGVLPLPPPDLPTWDLPPVNEISQEILQALGELQVQLLEDPEGARCLRLPHYVPLPDYQRPWTSEELAWNRRLRTITSHTPPELPVPSPLPEGPELLTPPSSPSLSNQHAGQPHQDQTSYENHLRRHTAEAPTDSPESPPPS